jgi:cytoskeleton protein RodZ
MSEAADTPAVPGAASAGRLLRQARERQGLHIAALAASIKVAQKKLEMLEADRFDALPDATFTRALAQTVCRALKIDSAPILALLPPPVGHRLEQVASGLNAPFRDRPGAFVQREGSWLAPGPWAWLTALVAVAAVAVFFVPAGMIRVPHWAGRPATVAMAASEPAAVSSEPALLPGETAAASAATAAAPLSGAFDGSVAASAAAPAAPLVATAPAPAASGSPAPMAPTDAAEAPVGVLLVRASEASWVEVTDARGRSLVARLIKPGEAVGLDGEAPFRLRIGNASATQVSFRGQPMALAAYTRDNVARFELK